MTGSVSFLLSKPVLTALKLSIAVMTVLIAVGLVLLVIGFKNKATMLASRSLSSAEIILPSGLVYRSMRAAGDNKIWIEALAKDRVIMLLLYDEAGNLEKMLEVKQGE